MSSRVSNHTIWAIRGKKESWKMPQFGASVIEWIVLPID